MLSQRFRIKGLVVLSPPDKFMGLANTDVYRWTTGMRYYLRAEQSLGSHAMEQLAFHLDVPALDYFKTLLSYNDIHNVEEVFLRLHEMYGRVKCNRCNSIYGKQ